MADRQDVLPLSVHLYFLLLAHINSSVNSIIYGLTNKQFRYDLFSFYTKEIFVFLLTKITFFFIFFVHSRMMIRLGPIVFGFP